MPLDQAANEQRPVNKTCRNTVNKVASGSLVVHSSRFLAALFFSGFAWPRLLRGAPMIEVLKSDVGARRFNAPPFRSQLLFAETVVAQEALGPHKENFSKGGASSCAC